MWARTSQLFSLLHYLLTNGIHDHQGCSATINPFDRDVFSEGLRYKCNDGVGKYSNRIVRFAELLVINAPNSVRILKTCPLGYEYITIVSRKLYYFP